MEERRDAPVLLLALLVAVWMDNGLRIYCAVGEGVGCMQMGFTAGVPVKHWLLEEVFMIAATDVFSNI
jgi:hypothetical protein